MNNSTLLTKCKERDLAAWGLFVRRMSPLVKRSIFYKLRNLGLSRRKDIADDIHQEIFYTLWEKEKLKTVRDARALEGWIAIVSMNATSNWCKKNIFRQESSCVSFEKVLFRGQENIKLGDILSSEKFDTAEKLKNNEIRRLLEKEIELLPRQQKLALKFNLHDGLKHREIANIMNVPINTVSTLIKRSKDTLSKKIGSA